MKASSQNTERIARMIEYLNLLVEGPVAKEIFEKYRPVLENATPFEVNSALESLLSTTDDIAAAEFPVARFIRSVGKALEAQRLPSYEAGSLLNDLSQENDEVGSQLVGLQTISKELHQDHSLSLARLQEAARAFELLQQHYIRLQNELFPLFEEHGDEHSCVKLMWTLQDEALAARKAVLSYEGEEREKFWRIFGRFYVLAGLLNFREKYILYPVAHRALAQQQQSEPTAIGAGFASLTGSLSNEELQQIFATLPFDIAFIGSDDRVKYYSDPPHRIFPRSPQVVGRLVQNCHPPKSVDTVEQILSTFKDGSADHAEFYLTLKGSFVHIQYFAVRSTDGKYMGTMEVSQDATHIRSLTGEKRLL